MAVSLNLSENYSLFRIVSGSGCVAVSNVSWNFLLLTITEGTMLTPRSWETGEEDEHTADSAEGEGLKTPSASSAGDVEGEHKKRND